MVGSTRFSIHSFFGVWLQAGLVIACLAMLVWQADFPSSRFVVSGGFERESLVALFSCLLFLRGVSCIRSHLLLRRYDLSVHVIATGRVRLAQLARNWLPWVGLKAEAGWVGLYGQSYGFSTDQLRPIRRRDALLARDWMSWILALCGRMHPDVLEASPRRRGGLALCLAVELFLGCLVLFLALRAAGYSSAARLELVWVIPLAWVAGGWTNRFAEVGPRELLLSLVLVPGGTGAVLVLKAMLLLLAFHLVEVALGLRYLNGLKRGDSCATPWAVAKSISVVIPVLNEVNNLEETVRRVRLLPEVCEVIIVDGGSQDGTQLLGLSLGCPVLSCAPGRGGQLRLGAQRATGDVILLLHADTWVEVDAGSAILHCLRDPSVVGGGFWKRFREHRWLLVGSRLKCAIRVWLGGRIVGDMAMFVRSDALKRIGGVPDIELMEDFELSRRLRPLGRLALADGLVTTSARRFIEKGILTTSLRMWQITMLYRLGRPPAELRRLYG